MGWSPLLTDGGLDEVWRGVALRSRVDTTDVREIEGDCSI